MCRSIYRFPRISTPLLVSLILSVVTPFVRAAEDPQETLERLFQQQQRSQIETYLDQQLLQSYDVRSRLWRRDLTSIPAYLKSIAPWREKFADYLGGMHYTPARLDPHEELIWDRPTHQAWRVRFRAFDEVEVYGVLLIPKQFQGPRPALICVHGMAGTPELVCGIVPRTDYHRRFGLQAVERGYVVFAPLNINSASRREWLDRKAIMLGERLQGLEQFKHRRIVDYLTQRPEVAADRIGIYGISWGGRTAMYAAALDQRLAACVISGHFMESTRKMVWPHEPESYSTYIEAGHGYAFFPRQATEFADADVVSLICPRVVHIEQGRFDRVSTWPEAQAEFTKVQGLYQQLGIADRATFEIFEGEHFVAGLQAFEVLAKWLKP